MTNDQRDALPAAIPQPEHEFLPYARLLELCAAFGITESDELKHALEDWQRWHTEHREGLGLRPAALPSPSPAVDKLAELITAWKQFRDEEDNDDFGRERASTMDNCIEDAEALLVEIKDGERLRAAIPQPQHEEKDTEDLTRVDTTDG